MRLAGVVSVVLVRGVGGGAFLTRREEVAFERECDPAERAGVMEVTWRSQVAREALVARRASREKILVVEVPEQWTTFGHFVTLLSQKRATAVAVAAATGRALFYKNCAYDDDPDAITGIEPVKSHGVHLHNCAQGFIDFEQYFGLPNCTNVAWPRNDTPRLERVLQEVAVDEVLRHSAPAITMTVWKAAKLADEIARRANTNLRRRRPNFSCALFASTRPVGDVWTQLEPTARQIDRLDSIVGLHLRTGYADHGTKMDDPFNAKTGNIEKLSQFSVTYPDLFYESRKLPRDSTQWMDKDFAAFSSRRFPGADDVLSCKRPLFELLALSRTIECLDAWTDNVGVVLATDHATYYNIMVTLVKHAVLLAPERVRHKESSDTHGHFWHTSAYASTRGQTKRVVRHAPATAVDWQALGIVAAIELHLLAFCDTLLIYGPSVYQRAAQQLAVSANFQLISLNMGAPGVQDNPTNRLIAQLCNRGCYDAIACECAQTPTGFDFLPPKKGFIPH